MMDFKKDISLSLWEQQTLELTHQEAEDQTKELQLLRVTKALQAIIKAGGKDSQQAHEISVIERKIDHLRDVCILTLSHNDSIYNTSLTLCERYVD
jgi:hypothetical protein